MCGKYSGAAQTKRWPESKNQTHIRPYCYGARGKIRKEHTKLPAIKSCPQAGPEDDLDTLLTKTNHWSSWMIVSLSAS